MKKIIITKADLDENNYYKEDGIGYSGPDYEGSVEIAENLGCVKFKKGIYVTGEIVAKAGSGIEAGEGIKAGSGIEAGEGIKAGWGIKAGEGIKAGSGIEAGWGIKAGWGIEAGEGIKAGSGIEAGWGIKAGWDIKAGWGIKAGEGIKAGWGIVCKLGLSFSYKLFAGVSPWTNNADKKITCGKLLKGTIAYGDLVETGMPEEVETNDATENAIKLLKENGYKIIKV